MKLNSKTLFPWAFVRAGMTSCPWKIVCLIFLLSWRGSFSSASAQPLPQRGDEQFTSPPPFGREGAPKAPPLSENPNLFGGRPWRRGPLRGDFQQRREERHRRIERAREMANQLLENPNTPNDVKAKARRLSDLLSKRDRLEQQLEGKRQSFLHDHQAEINELRQLQERAEQLRGKLRSARGQALNDNLADIQEMRRTTQEARDIAQELRQQYQERRRREQD
jgi:hypothetical protein